jgi:WD40 repeat protein
VSGSGDESIRIWDASTGKMEKMLTGHQAKINAVALDRDDDTIIAAAYDGTMAKRGFPTG